MGVEFDQPRHMGGNCYVLGVSVGRRTDEETVWDCPGCPSYVYADRWHVAVTVQQRRGRQRHRYCSPGCLQEWLALSVRP